jgi:hypothetical protein
VRFSNVGSFQYPTMLYNGEKLIRPAVAYAGAQPFYLF